MPTCRHLRLKAHSIEDSATCTMDHPPTYNLNHSVHLDSQADQHQHCLLHLNVLQTSYDIKPAKQAIVKPCQITRDPKLQRMGSVSNTVPCLSACDGTNCMDCGVDSCFVWQAQRYSCIFSGSASSRAPWVPEPSPLPLSDSVSLHLLSLGPAPDEQSIHLS